MSKLNKIPANLNEVERELYALKLQKLEQLENQERLKVALPHRYAQKHYPWSREFFDNITDKVQCLTASNQVGKMLQRSALIITPHGPKAIGDLTVGEQVIGDDGKPCNVTGIPFEGVDEFFRITFDDGTTIEAGQSHLWRCKGERERFRSPKGWVVETTAAMFKNGKYGEAEHRPIHRYIIPYVAPIEFLEKELPIDPYDLGVLLGDGCITGVTNSISLCTPDDKISERFVERYGARSAWGRSKKQCYTVNIRGTLLYPQLKALGLLGTYSHTKFIPKEYLLGSVEQRLALLRALLDTDGCTHSTTVEYNTASKQLADGVDQLVFSLGGTVKHSVRTAFYTHKGERKQGKDSHRLRIKLPPGMNPFSLAQNKVDQWMKSEGDIRYKHVRVIRSIEPIGPKEGRCISVDSPNQCYVAGLNYVVTHNSSVNIKKCIEWCVNKDLWPKLWPVQMAEGSLPSLFWYLYPDKVLATAEFEDKWRPLLPGDPDHPEYGYRIWYRNRQIERIDWKSGISLHFKGYAQDQQSLQGGSVWAMYLDEEVPVDLLSELQTRVSATDGYLHFVFTATLGQTFWRDVVERRTQWPHARVWQISHYDCMKFEDGTPTRWTKEKIQRAIDACISPAEVQRRVFGKFVKDEGLKYQTFDREKHFVPYVKPPADWIYIGGADYGSGGKNHPSAVTIVAVSPDFTKGCVVRHWRGDNLITTSEDVVLKCVEMSRGLEVRTWYYDYSAKDLATYAQNSGLPFETAEKSHAIGEGALNTLFKSGCFVLMMPNEEYEKEVPSQEYLECYKMADEFESLAVETNKTKARDDSIDSCRYAIAKIQWNWEQMNNSLAARRKKPAERMYTEEELRRQYILGDGKDPMELSMEEEIDEWNELMAP